MHLVSSGIRTTDVYTVRCDRRNCFSSGAGFRWVKQKLAVKQAIPTKMTSPCIYALCSLHFYPFSTDENKIPAVELAIFTKMPSPCMLDPCSSHYTGAGISWSYMSKSHADKMPIVSVSESTDIHGLQKIILVETKTTKMKIKEKNSSYHADGLITSISR
jgi:hypothetical protein